MPPVLPLPLHGTDIGLDAYDTNMYYIMGLKKCDWMTIAICDRLGALLK